MCPEVFEEVRENLLADVARLHTISGAALLDHLHIKGKSQTHTDTLMSHYSSILDDSELACTFTPRQSVCLSVFLKRYRTKNMHGTTDLAKAGHILCTKSVASCLRSSGCVYCSMSSGQSQCCLMSVSHGTLSNGGKELGCEIGHVTTGKRRRMVKTPSSQ